jgi:hypothetical protein
MNNMVSPTTSPANRQGSTQDVNKNSNFTSAYNSSLSNKVSPDKPGKEILETLHEDNFDEMSNESRSSSSVS